MSTERHSPREVSLLEIDGVCDVDGVVPNKSYQRTLCFEDGAHQLHDMLCRSKTISDISSKFLGQARLLASILEYQRVNLSLLPPLLPGQLKKLTVFQ